MELSYEKQGSVKIIGLNGRLDTSNYIQFENKLLEEISQDSTVLIDFADLDYISSSGLRVLLLALKKAEKINSQLALCSLQTGIMEVFKISAFNSIFSIYPDKQDALEKLRDQSK
jgi:anti-sigma B factor antagonist